MVGCQHIKKAGAEFRTERSLCRRAAKQSVSRSVFQTQSERCLSDRCRRGPIGAKERNGAVRLDTGIAKADYSKNQSRVTRLGSGTDMPVLYPGAPELMTIRFYRLATCSLDQHPRNDGHRTRSCHRSQGVCPRRLVALYKPFFTALPMHSSAGTVTNTFSMISGSMPSK